MYTCSTCTLVLHLYIFFVEIESRKNLSGSMFSSLVLLQGGEYEMTNIPYDGRGLYICDALNEVGEDRRDVTITVIREFHPLLF